MDTESIPTESNHMREKATAMILNNIPIKCSV